MLRCGLGIYGAERLFWLQNGQNLGQISSICTDISPVTQY